MRSGFCCQPPPVAEPPVVRPAVIDVISGDAAVVDRVTYGHDRIRVRSRRDVDAYYRWRIATATLASNYTATSTGAPKFPGFTGQSSNSGWFIGGGVDWAVNKAISVGLDYRHFELGSARATTQLSTGDNDNIALAAKGDIVWVRLSFNLIPGAH
jgi:hypothetical protein